MRFEEPISGALLMAGSLYWDDHATRKSLRNKFLLMPNSKSVPAPIRYGRKSDKRNTVTMVFSNSCASNDMIGRGKLVPFKNEITSSKEFDEITRAIIKAEHKKEPNFSRFNWEWGCLAVLINPKAKSKSAKQIKDYWSKKIGKKFDPKEYKIGKEKPVVSPLGVLQIDWQTEYGEVDFVVVTATKPNINPIPEFKELATHFTSDGHYFENNYRNGISTYQDKEVLATLKPRGAAGIAKKFDWLPEDWTSKSLGQLFEFKNGINADKESYGRGVRFINVMEVIYNDHIIPGIIPGSVHISKDQRDLFMVKNGDVLFNRTSETTNEIGLSAVYLGDDPVVFGGFVIRGRPVDSSLDNNYKRYCFRAKIIRDQIIKAGQGGIRTNIGQDDLAKVVIPLPPIKEQIAIASLLSKWDKAINTLSQLITQKEQAKKWLMQQLLTGTYRLKGFKGKWEDVELGDLLEYEQPTKYLVKNDLYDDAFKTPVLTAGKTFILGYTDEKDGICKELPVVIFDDFTTSSKFVDFPFKAKSSAMKFLRPKQNVDLKYVFEAMQLMKYAVGGHERHWISKFIYLTIPCPPYEEQTAIARVMQTADNEIKLLKRKNENYKKQKKGLIQALLTGKKRIKI